MIKYVLLVLIGIILVESMTLILLIQWIGVLYTGLFLFLFCSLGVYLVVKKVKTLLRFSKNEFAVGIIPTASVLDTICLVIAGFLFLFPGICTDILAFTLLVPYSRTKLQMALIRYLRTKLWSYSRHHYS